MWRKGLKVAGAIGLSLALIVGCSNGGNGGDQSEGGGLSGNLIAVGSSAMQPLVEEAAAKFMEENSGVNITVQGGGSGAGLSAAMDGSANIGNSDVFAEEKDGIDSEKVEDHQVFVVGMGPVVHPEVGVDELTQEQLIDIFTGEVKNWKEVGGKDQEIVLVNRPESSGTRATFAKFALDNNEEFRGKGGIEEDSSGTVQKIVGETPGAIGYLAFSYFNDKVTPLKLDGVEPTDENVYSGEWYVWAYQHMYTNKDSQSKELEQAFIDYILSDEIQESLIPELGYIPVNKMEVERDPEGKVSEKK
ncbi:phosphate ABC transporter substrate-binding protein PstS family protein [Desmospora activa]|uniref:Phosphate-binding protein n=1 Tax=Desmospora activa DSM 45169 TaxID=1121389 RepID=A0A2T4Z896_9BACL|nr:phosphate ABC transporter substrate-binding protein PstS family protein [Desmospora activa]PTM58094.1 phosphate ABC transporter substrate-binding protein (PhoT family) [Desmospora activa DSM 45169]